MAAAGAKLTANLTLSALSLPLSSIHDVERAQLSNRMGLVCTLSGAAYTGWLQQQFPGIQLNMNAGNYAEMVTEMAQGHCDAMILPNPTAKVSCCPMRMNPANTPCYPRLQEGHASHPLSPACVPMSPQYLATVLENCDLNLALIGQPLAFGPQDMAVGVHKGMQDVSTAISYWIQSLRSCSPTVPGVCYNGMNMEKLYAKWFDPGMQCAVVRASTALSSDVFMQPFMVIWAIAVAALLFELMQPRCIDRVMAIFHGHRLLECVAKGPFAPRISGAPLDLGNIRKTFRTQFFTSVHGRGHEAIEARRVYRETVCCLRRYLVGEELEAWGLLVGISKELENEITIGQKITIGQTQAASNVVSTWKKAHVMFTLAKYAARPRDEAAAFLALFWRERAKRQRWRTRSEELLHEQEQMLLSSIAVILSDRERRTIKATHIRERTHLASLAAGKCTNLAKTLTTTASTGNKQQTGKAKVPPAAATVSYA